VPERQTEELLKDIGAKYSKQVEIKTKTWDYPFTIDFVITSIPSRKFNKQCILESQGFYHFQSKRQINKSKWRSECLANSGYPVILLDYEWLELDDIEDRLKTALTTINLGQIIQLSDRCF